MGLGFGIYFLLFALRILLLTLVYSTLATQLLQRLLTRMPVILVNCGLFLQFFYLLLIDRRECSAQISQTIFNWAARPLIMQLEVIKVAKSVVAWVARSVFEAGPRRFLRALLHELAAVVVAL